MKFYNLFLTVCCLHSLGKCYTLQFANKITAVKLRHKSKRWKKLHPAIETAVKEALKDDIKQITTTISNY